MITFFGGKVQRNKKVFRSGIFQRTKTNLDFTDTGMSFRLWYTSTTLVFILVLLYLQDDTKKNSWVDLCNTV